MTLPGGDYVYVHRRKTDGTIFYVGKGRGRRYIRRDNRNKHWHHTVQKHGYTAEIVKDGMPAVCALSYERALIHSLGRASLVNLSSGGDGVAGITCSDEKKEAIGVKLGIPVWNDAGEVFASNKHAARAMVARGYLKAAASAIWICTRDATKTAYGHSWSVHGVPSKPALVGIAKIASVRAIKIRSITTGEIFNSAAEAARSVSGCRNWITACCKGRAKSAYGQEWEYFQGGNGNG